MIIGDAYMVVSGLPIPDPASHAINMANFAYVVSKVVATIKNPITKQVWLQIYI